MYDVVMVPVMVMLPDVMMRWCMRCCVLVLSMLMRKVMMGLVCAHWMRLMRRLRWVLMGMRVWMQMAVSRCWDNRLGLRPLSLSISFISLPLFSVACFPIHAASKL